MKALKSNLWDLNHAYVPVRANITVVSAPVDLNLAMLMQNLIEYNSNCSATIGSLSFYSKEDAASFGNNIVSTDDFKSFKYKAKLLEDKAAQPNPNHANIVLENERTAVPLSYLNNFWRSLDILMINCRVELKHKQTKYCVLSAGGNNNNDDNPDNFIFTMKHMKLFVPVVTLSAKGNQKLSKLLSKGFERPVYWN